MAKEYIPPKPPSYPRTEQSRTKGLFTSRPEDEAPNPYSRIKIYNSLGPMSNG